jgi:hypothetical protein
MPQSLADDLAAAILQEVSGGLDLDEPDANHKQSVN